MISATREEITGEEFAEFLRLGGCGPVVPLLVRGGVDLSGTVFERDLEINGVLFTGRVVLAGARFEVGLTISGCHFEAGLTLAGCQVARSLEIVELNGRKGPRLHITVFKEDKSAALDLRHARIGGSLRIESVSIRGGEGEPALRAEHLRVDGSVRLSNLIVCAPEPRVALNPSLPWWPRRTVAEFDHASIGGSFHLADLPGRMSTSSAFANVSEGLVASWYGGSVSGRGMTVAGDVVLGAAEIGRSLTWGRGEERLRSPYRPGLACGSGEWMLQRLGLMGDLDLSSARVGGSLTTQVGVGQPLALGAPAPADEPDDPPCLLAPVFPLRILGSLRLVGSSWGGSARLESIHTAGAIDAERIEAGLLQVFGTFTAYFDLSSAKVTGGVLIGDTQIGVESEPSAKALELTGADVHGLYIGATPVSLGKRTFGGQVVIFGDVTAGRLKCRTQMLVGCSERTPAARWVEGNAGGIDPIWDTALPSGLEGERRAASRRDLARLQGVWIDGKLDIWGSEITNELRIDAARISGTLRVLQSEVARVEIGRTHPAGVAANEILIQSSRIAERIMCGRLRIGAVRPDRAITRGRLEIIGTNVRQDILFGSGRIEVAGVTHVVTWSGRDRRSLWLARELLIKDSTVGGNILFRRAMVGGVLAQHGDRAIRVQETRIHGTLRFCTPEDDLREGDPDIAVHARAILEATKGAGTQVFCTLADELELRNVIAREVGLGGLRLRGRPGPGGGRVVAADLVAREFRLISAAGPWGTMRGAHIPGSLDLSRARLGQLVIRADSFDGGSSAPKDDGIVLCDAEIGVLAVPERCGPVGCRGRGFPIPLDMAGLTVRDWRLCRSPDESGSVADDHLDLLDNDIHLNRPLYRAIARQMQEQGQDWPALQMHVAENFRARFAPRALWRPGLGRLRRWTERHFRGRRLPTRSVAEDTPWLRFRRALHLFHFGDRFLFRHGRSLWPASLLIAFLALLSFLFVSVEPRNFELSATARQLIGAQARQVQYDGPALARGIDSCDDTVVLGPDPSKWGPWHAVWMTVRAHVPVAGLVFRDDFSPTDDRGLILALRLPSWAGGVSDGMVEPAAIRSAVADLGADLPCGGAPAAEHRAIGWLTPEDWFAVMALLNWILWPLLLSYAVSRLIRN